MISQSPTAAGKEVHMALYVHVGGVPSLAADHGIAGLYRIDVAVRTPQGEPAAQWAHAVRAAHEEAQRSFGLHVAIACPSDFTVTTHLPTGEVIDPSRWPDEGATASSSSSLAAPGASVDFKGKVALADVFPILTCDGWTHIFPDAWSESVTRWAMSTATNELLHAEVKTGHGGWRAISASGREDLLESLLDNNVIGQSQEFDIDLRGWEAAVPSWAAEKCLALLMRGPGDEEQETGEQQGRRESVRLKA